MILSSFGKRAMIHICKFSILLGVVILSLCHLDVHLIPLQLKIFLTIGKFASFFVEYDNIYGVYSLCLRKYQRVESSLFQYLSSTMLRVLLIQKGKIEKTRFHHLDGLRGVAALVVVIFHCVKIDFSNEIYSNYVRNTTTAYFYYPSHLGSHMVDFFVCLSGFILGKVYWNNKRSQDLYHLIAGRGTRFYPLHWLTASVYLCSTAYIGKYYNQGWINRINPDGIFRCLSLTHVWNYYFTSWEPFVVCSGPSWSLSVELLINLLMFFFIRYLPDFACIFVFELLISIGYVSNKDGSMVFPLFYAFFMGCLAAKLLGWIQSPLRATRIIFDGLALYQFLNFKSLVLVDFNGEFTFDYFQTRLNVTSYSIYLFLYLDQSFLMSKVLGNPILKFLGKISFSLYLCHFPMLIFATAVNKNEKLFSSNYEVVSFSILAITVASIANRFFEEPSRIYFHNLLGLDSGKKNVNNSYELLLNSDDIVLSKAS